MHGWMLILAAQTVMVVGVDPLSDSQRTRMEAVDDHTTTHEDAGFYALLENVATWDDTLTGAVVPDYRAITDDPQSWRGAVVLIEGQLESVITDLTLSRSGVGPVQRWSIVVDSDPPGPVAASHDPSGRVIMVYLTDAPDVELQSTDQGLDVLREPGARVRLAARFYKLVDEQSLGAGRLSYPAFVGRSVAELIPAQRGGNARPIVTIFVVIGALAVVYVLMRVAIRRGTRTPWRDRIGSGRHANDEDTPIPEPSDALPEDPAAALSALQREHRES